MAGLEVRDSLLFAACRLASAGAGWMAPAYLLWRGLLGHDDLSRRKERLGFASIKRPAGNLILLYAGEAAEARILPPLEAKLVELGFTVLLLTGSAEAAPFFLPRLPQVLHQLAPMSAPQLVARCLDHWQPLAVLIAGEVIPLNLVCEARRRGLLAALVDASMPPRTFSIWCKFPGLAASLFRQIALCLARTDADGERFAALGMRNVETTGNLKYDCTALPADQAALARLVARIGTRPVWLAEAIAPGEEEIAIEAHCGLALELPNLLTVIVPRNARRAAEICQIAEKAGLRATAGSLNENSGPLPDVFIAHKDKEAAGLFYRSAGVVFCGGSLSDGQGANPLLPAGLGCAILHGPESEEFEEIFTELDKSGGGALVTDAQALVRQLSLLFSDAARLRAMGRAAAATAELSGGASRRIIKALAPFLCQAVTASAGRPMKARRDKNDINAPAGV
ncbi:MAG TPA: glycosyltransferase N-terminal domain-containing protein [Methylocella sp.]|nr:glycosyltransferase N-terminal domain-containing protein [Methylocella sp.]